MNQVSQFQKSYSVPLETLKADLINAFSPNPDLTVVIIHDGQNWRAFHDVCPHMGGPLSQGWLCPKTDTLVCSWHGYKYSKKTLTFVENPNEKIWVKPLAAECLDQYKTPVYKLREFQCQIKNTDLLIEEI